MTYPVSSRAAGPYAGEVVYLFAYDVAYEVRGQVPRLLGRPAQQFETAATRRMPREPFFYCPQMFDLSEFQGLGPPGPAAARGTVKIFPVGAISIAVRVPFEVARLEDLVAYHDLPAASGGTLQAQVRSLAERILEELRPYCIRPVKGLKEDEAYTVFCLRSPVPGMAAESAADASSSAPPLAPPTFAAAGAEAWLQDHRRLVAAILTQEPDVASLSMQEALESTALYLSYYETDLAVIDWDAALVIDEPEDFEETLHVMELANVQLMELGVFDQILDDAVGRAYRDLRRAPDQDAGPTRRSWRGRRDIQRDLGEIRIDLERLRDELFNITKFFGDWHLAKLYQHLSSRFHLADWSRIIEGKLRTLDDLYQALKTDQNNRAMLVLEAMIVLLFIIDLVILVIGLK